jgi:hypothetical protein
VVVCRLWINHSDPAKWMPESVWLNCIALSRTVGMLRDLPDNLE